MGPYKLLTIFTICIICSGLIAAETCSRVAIINHQEVLVDTSSTRRGEGLRYYLGKDIKAVRYLDSYQELSRPRWVNATLGTLGTALLVAGLTKSKTPGRHFGPKEQMFSAGVILMALNFFSAKNSATSNERILQKSIEEYNKRNLPKIYFGPTLNDSKNGIKSIGVVGGFSGEF